MYGHYFFADLKCHCAPPHSLLIMVSLHGNIANVNGADVAFHRENHEQEKAAPLSSLSENTMAMEVT